MVRQQLLALVRSRPFRPLRRAARTILDTETGRRARTSAALPLNWRNSLRLAKILWFQYGHLRSAAAGASVDAAGDPVPWYTYPALEYLKQLDLSTARLFEYGSGNSTLWWSRQVASVVAVEHNEDWFTAVSRKAPANCELLLRTTSDEYAAAIDGYPGGFDIIVIDGLVTGRTRLRCTRAALRCLRKGGLIILDNSDWLPESSHALRTAGLLEVDMTGFTPINDYTSTTSFYFDRAFNFAPRQDRQPVPGTGALPYTWEPRSARDEIPDDTCRGIDTAAGLEQPAVELGGRAVRPASG